MLNTVGDFQVLTNSHLATLAKELIDYYKNNECKKLMKRLDQIKEETPIVFNNEFIKEMHVNTMFKYANYLMKNGDYQLAKTTYEQLLEYEHDYMLDSELVVYEIYTKLSDVYSLCQEKDLAIFYNKKARSLIRKMMAAKEVQNLYITMTTSEPKDVIKTAKRIDVDMLDEYNKAKMNMVLGNAYFNIRHYKTAVGYLEAAIEYYEEKTYNSLTILMYEELSKCYSNLDEHELAVEYMIKSKKSQEQRHQLS